MYTVITENDESKWADETGSLYHFPKRYEKYLLAGTQVLYYKGKIKNVQYRNARLSDSPHYFGVARIGKVYKDRQSSRGDLFATIIEYSPFEMPVIAKIDDGYYEQIPASKKVNYWRDGVRPIDKTVFDSVCDKAQIVVVQNTNDEDHSPFNDVYGRLESIEEGKEGKEVKRYVTTYERIQKYRDQAIAIHGASCKACDFNFGKYYGEYAEGFIHIHHCVPVSTYEKPRALNPEVDLVPLCANCHSIIHRRKDKTLSVDELIAMIKSASGVV